MMVATLIGLAGHSVIRPVEMEKNTALDPAPIPRQLMAGMIVRGLGAIRKCPFATTDLAKLTVVLPTGLTGQHAAEAADLV